ncbi:carbohydrate ABC transporter permease [Cohnella nanjingensis]|uniref:Carbohydrate ABC transporter permease n=1 Tax=Cohnella nanjingensis TaxID=1387779 RepID=A0A7X0RM77_9BACL|nr:carbohydrate ABC transporter permease [Cohnella nanjingensis]MBB6670109.1 carbohydrate ABC transporter permease [Cohnella nanjingensis]
MKGNTSIGRLAFPIFNYLFLSAFALLCLLPLVHVLAISFSSGTAASSGQVTLWPVHFTFKAYEFVANKPEFIRSMMVSFERVLLGVPIDMLLIITIAYPLSKDERMLSFRKGYVVFYMITILFGGGLIPWYMVIKMTGLIDSIFALILPGAVSIFSVIILLNFFRNLPKEIEEAAFIDGAGHWYTLWKIYVPLSMPAIATLILFSSVGHWNSWFDGIILMNRTEHYPLQSYLQTVVVQQGLLKMITIQDTQTLLAVSDRTNKAAQIFIGALPILLVYPFLQRYFMSGIVMGSVKG